MTCHWRKGMCVGCQYRRNLEVGGTRADGPGDTTCLYLREALCKKATRSCFTTTAWPDAMSNVWDRSIERRFQERARQDRAPIQSC